MALYRHSEGKLVTLEHCTAASNMAAGDFVALNIVSAIAPQVYTCGDSVAGVSATALLGNCFAGILDHDVSAGECPVRVWTEGVFEMRLSSATTTGNVRIGQPVWIDSGNYVTTPGQTGEFCMGSLVSVPSQGPTTATMITGCPWVKVKINPGVWRSATWFSPDGFTGTGQGAAGSATPHWGSYPPTNIA